MPKLKNEKHEFFCQEYIKDLVIAYAYKRVFKKANDATAKRNGHNLFARPEVKDRINELMEKRYKKAGYDSDSVLNELAKIAFADIADAFKDDGSLKSIKEMPEGIRKSVSSIKVNELYEGFGKERIQIGEVKEIKFWDKNKSLENLGKHFKLFTEKVELSGDKENPIQVKSVDIEERIKDLLGRE